jgi:predicted nuclease with TOPRIM domain
MEELNMCEENLRPYKGTEGLLEGSCISDDDEMEFCLTRKMEALEKEKNDLRRSHQATACQLEATRCRLKNLKEDLCVHRQAHKNLLKSRINLLERELGCVSYLQNCHFTSEEISDLKSYISNNPYLYSLLQQRNARLLKTLLEYH